MSKILVAVRHFWGGSIFCSATNPSFRHVVAIPLEPISKEWSQHVWRKDLVDIGPYFVFQNIPAAVKSTYASISGKVVGPNCSQQWFKVGLELTTDGFKFIEERQ